MLPLEYDYFIDPDHWIGGYYELSIEYHPSGDDKRLNEALTALSTFGFFNGMWEERKEYLTSPISLPVSIEDDSVRSFFGVFSLAEGIALPCLISIVRVSGESDWLHFGIPQASFEKHYPNQYPLTKKLNPWLHEVDGMYLRLAEMIYEASPFDFAMIGEEISGYTNQEEITADMVKNLTCITYILPRHLQIKLGLQGKGKELSNQLRYFE